MKVFILMFSLLGTIRTIAQTQNKLYYANESNFIAPREVFVFIRGDTAFSQGLSEKHGQLYVGRPETDTMYKKAENLYVGARYMVSIKDKQLYFIRKKLSKKNSALLLSIADEEIMRIWNKRNNLLVYYQLDSKYEEVLDKLIGDSQSQKKIEQAYRELRDKAKALDQEAFRKESRKFEIEYLEE